MVECVRNLPVHHQSRTAWNSRPLPDAMFADTDATSRPPELDTAPKRGGDILYLPVLRSDAVLVVLQIQDYRSCRFWLDGSTTPVDFTFAGNAACPPNGAGRWFHFYVSRQDAASRPNYDGHRPAGPLPYPPSVRISDAIDHRLGECLVEAARAVGGAEQRLNERLLETLLECLLLSLHVDVGRPQVKPCPPAPSGRGGLAPWQVRRATQIMSEKQEGTVSIEEMAAACRLSQSHFARAFKITTGQAPHRWLLQHRVEQAKQLMLQSNRTLADIALTCGFADQSHFAKIFSRFAGLPPGAWRRAQHRVVPPAQRVTDRHSPGNDNMPMPMLASG